MDRNQPPMGSNNRSDNFDGDNETRKRKASRSRSGSNERTMTLDDPRGSDFRQGNARMNDIRSPFDGRRDERGWSDRREDRGGGGRGDFWGGRGGGRGGGYQGPPHGRGFDHHGRGREGPNEGYREMHHQQGGRMGGDHHHHPFSPMYDDRQRGQGQGYGGHGGQGQGQGGGGYRDEIRAIDEANRRNKKGNYTTTQPQPTLTLTERYYYPNITHPTPNPSFFLTSTLIRIQGDELSSEQPSSSSSSSSRNKPTTTATTTVSKTSTTGPSSSSSSSSSLNKDKKKGDDKSSTTTPTKTTIEPREEDLKDPEVSMLQVKKMDLTTSSSLTLLQKYGVKLRWALESGAVMVSGVF